MSKRAQDPKVMHLDPNFLDSKFFCGLKIVLDLIFFGSQIYFDPNYYLFMILAQNILDTKNFCTKIFQASHFSDFKFFVLIFLGPHFWDSNFLVPNFFYCIFFGHNFFKTNNFFEIFCEKLNFKLNLTKLVFAV